MHLVDGALLAEALLRQLADAHVWSESGPLGETNGGVRARHHGRQEAWAGGRQEGHSDMQVVWDRVSCCTAAAARQREAGNTVRQEVMGSGVVLHRCSSAPWAEAESPRKIAIISKF